MEKVNGREERKREEVYSHNSAPQRTRRKRKWKNVKEF